MERARTKLKVASLAVVAALAAPLALAVPVGAKVVTPAPTAAGNYLAKGLRGDATVRATAGGPIQVGNTVQVALSLKAAGLRSSQVAKATSTLVAYVAGRRKAKKLSTIDVGTLAYLALLAHATGRNPSMVGSFFALRRPAT